MRLMRPALESPGRSHTENRRTRLSCSSVALLICALPTALCWAAGNGPISDNPYRSISRRNIFGLREPAPVRKVEPLPEPLSTILLTGITTILGDKRALLEITAPVKPPQPSRQQSCVLAEGQHEGQVEVLQIDPRAGCVKVSNGGTVMTLTFEQNGRKSEPTTPAPPPRVAFSLPRRQLPYRTASH